jgi:hypothetical protein
MWKRDLTTEVEHGVFRLLQHHSQSITSTICISLVMRFSIFVQTTNIILRTRAIVAFAVNRAI